MKRFFSVVVFGRLPRLRHHQSRGGEVMGCGLLLMSAVDVAGDEERDLPYL